MARTFITREFFPVNTTGFNNTFVSVFYDDVANTLVFINDKTGATVATIGGVALTTNLVAQVVATAAQAYFATAPAVAFGIGKIICVQNYNASGDAGTFQKVSTSNGTFADWKVIATEDKTATGAIGSSPI